MLSMMLGTLGMQLQLNSTSFFTILSSLRKIDGKLEYGLLKTAYNL